MLPLIVPKPTISPASLIPCAHTRYQPEFFGMSVLRSTGTLPCQTIARSLKLASMERPTITPLLLMVWQQGGPVAMAPGNRPRSCIPVALVHRNVSSGHVAGLVSPPAQANPTTCPRSLRLVAML